MRLEDYSSGSHASGIDLSCAVGPIAVLKFGSSILREREDLPRVVAEIYRYARKGIRVVAVVSAFEGDTDRLIDEAEALGADDTSIHAPRYIALGEERSAASLALACDKVGLAARVMSASALSFKATGDPRRADPVGIATQALMAVLASQDVVIVPGFVAISEKDEPVLLGRGGSDLTAIIIASELGLSEAALLKDVDGVYDQDPAKAGDSARRYKQISYENALEVAGELVQSRAINYARRRNVAIKVGRLAAAEETLLAKETILPAPHIKRHPLRVALAGCGIVGSGVATLLLGQTEDFELVGVLVRDLRKPRPAIKVDTEFVTQADALWALKPDVIVDVLSSGDLGLELTKAALERGVSVVTANKQALADTLSDLQLIAADKNAVLGIGSSVGGGATMIETVRRTAVEKKITRIEAVVNGTVNYILTELAKGQDFHMAVKAAQLAGFAEADPSADLSGADAVAKAKILAWEAFGQKVSDVSGLDVLDEQKLKMIASTPGVWRQVTEVSLSDAGTPVAKITYRKLDQEHPFFDLTGERNAIRIETECGSVITTKGRGAGAVPTAHSILGDLGAIRRRHG